MTATLRTASRPSARRRTGAALALLISLVVGVIAGTSGSAALERGPAAPSQDAAVPSMLTIASVSPWVVSDGEFQVRFEPSTSVPADAELTITVHQSLQPDDTLRASVSEIADGDAPGPVLRAPITRPMAEYGDPASGSVVTLPIRAGRGDRERILVPNAGVHPVRLALRSAEGEELWSSVVFLNRLPVGDEDDEARGHVQVTLLVPLDPGPAIGADGRGAFSIEQRTAVTATAALLERGRDLPLTLAPRPNTLDALMLTPEPWASDALDAITDPVNVDAYLALPYVALESGGLVASGNAAELDRQIGLGRSTLERVTGRESRHDTWAFDPTVTSPSLATMARAGIRSLVTLGAGLDVGDTDVELEEAAAVPARLEGDSGIRAITVDEDLSARLAEPGVDPAAQAHVLATMLMCTWFDHASEPGSPAAASLVLVTPGSNLDVLGALAPSLSESGPLRADPSAPPVPAEGPERSEETVPLAPRWPSSAQAAMTAAAATRLQTDAYRSIVGDADEDLWVWERINDQTMSTAIDDSVRLEMHAGVRGNIASRLDAIELPPARRVVLTSRETTIPLRFRNDLDVDASFVLHARSSRLEIVGGTTRTIVLHPGENRIDLPVRVLASGESLLRIDVSSPVSGLELEAADLPVRSTAISGVGAALSVVSGLFLVGWWILTTRRNRRRGAKVDGAHPSSTDRTGSLRSGG